MTVRQLLRNINSAELAEWRAFERVEPFGNTEYGADWRNALMISTLSGVIRGKKMFEIDHLVPDRYALLKAAPAEKQDPEVIKAMLIGALQPTTEKRKKRKREWGGRKRPKHKRKGVNG
jgi:hypothetical protein